ncbi:hypothetical protein [Puniceicoccus vermicola]|nr:hypothetical protein [Puniceicoccus vermicola]
MPVSFGVLKKARSANSIANMKHIGAAAALYAQERDGSIPTAWDATKYISWMQQLEGYGLNFGEDQEYMFCPLMVNRDASGNVGKVTSYAMNNHIGDRPNKKRWEGVDKIFQCADPSGTALLFNSFYHSNETSWKFSATPNPGSNVVIPADGTDVFVLFLDGSVREIPATDGRLPGGSDSVDAEVRSLFWNGR